MTFQKGEKIKGQGRPKRKYRNGQTKEMSIPSHYKENFLAKLDGRTSVHRLLRQAHDEIIADIGDVERMSHVKKCMIERFIFLEFVMSEIEQKIVQAPKFSTKLLARWIQAINSLSGLSKVIGLDRNSKKIESLSSYVTSKKKKRGRSKKE